MRPILWELEFGTWHLVLRAYGTCLAAAFALVLIFGAVAAIRRGLPARRALFVLAVASLATFVGARWFHWAQHPAGYAHSPDALWRLHVSGFALDGGLLLAVAVGWCGCRLAQISPWRLADALVVPLALGGAIMRLGCFLNGCCFGRPTSLPWGVTYPLGSRAHLHQAATRLDALLSGPVPVHPAQLYEAGAMLLAAVVALWAARRRLPDGTLALGVAGWLVAFRGLNRFFRAPEPASALTAIAVIFWISLIVAGAVAVKMRGRHPACP